MAGDVNDFTDEEQAGHFAALHGLSRKLVCVHASRGDFSSRVFFETIRVVSSRPSLAGGRVSSEGAGQLDVGRRVLDYRDRSTGVAVVGSTAELGAVSDDGVGPGRELRREPATRTDGCLELPAVPGGRDQGARDRLVEARWRPAALVLVAACFLSVGVGRYSMLIVLPVSAAIGVFFARRGWL